MSGFSALDVWCFFSSTGTLRSESLFFKHAEGRCHRYLHVIPAAWWPGGLKRVGHHRCRGFPAAPRSISSPAGHRRKWVFYENDTSPAGNSGDWHLRFFFWLKGKKGNKWTGTGLCLWERLNGHPRWQKTSWRGTTGLTAYFNVCLIKSIQRLLSHIRFTSAAAGSWAWQSW